MGFKQIKDSDRITFFNIFAEEMLLSISEKERAKLRINIEKIKQRIVKPPAYSGEAFKVFLKAQDKQRRINTTQIVENLQPSEYNIQTDEEVAAEKIKPMAYKQDFSKNPENIKQLIRDKFIQPKQIQVPKKIYPSHAPQDTLTAEKTITLGSGYKKIEVLLNDITIQSIECPGPGKNMIVKRYNQTNITKFTLNQQDINNIINEFSNQARIPVIGGILKAAVRNITISAVISEFVGSRFIITKSTPYSLIYNPGL